MDERRAAISIELAWRREAELVGDINAYKNQHLLATGH
jgi:hypothetical protein